MRILGIDPGSRLLGYGIVEVVGNKIQHVAHGTLRLASTGGKQTTPLEDRLLSIYEGLTAVIFEHHPVAMAVEKVFFAKNAVSALKLGQARGATILTGKIHNLSIVEYSASEVKQAVVGHGGADKEQVARMVTILTGQKDFDTFDASDGLALAICHAHTAKTMGGHSAGYAAALQAASGRRGKKSGSLADALGITLEQTQGNRRLDLSKAKTKT